MNANGTSPPGRPAEKRGGAYSLAASKLLTTCSEPGVYFIFSLPQVFRFTPNGERRFCVRCGAVVTNDSLGGHARKSALGGDLFCLGCADSWSN